MDNKILETLDKLLSSNVKNNLSSCIPACSQPLLATIKHPASVTPLMTWVYDRLIKRYTLDKEDNNIPVINRIPYIVPIMDMVWDTQQVIPDWGDLGIYRWNANNTMGTGHSVIIINMHQIRYSRYTQMLQVLKTLTINTMCSVLTKSRFSPCTTHVLIQHLECLPADNVCEFIGILECTMARIRTDIVNVNSFRYYMFASCNMANWKSNHLKKLKGISRHCIVSYKTKPTPKLSINSVGVGVDVGDFNDSWYHMLNLLGDDVVKTIVLHDNMPKLSCSSSPEHIKENIYAYVVSHLPGYMCLDKYICKIINISHNTYAQKNNSHSTNGKTSFVNKKKPCQIVDIFQMPMLLANGLISAGYNLYSIIHMTNVVCSHNCKLYNNTNNINNKDTISIVEYGKNMGKILKYGTLCIESSRDIDKPIMALTEYFQNIITVFCTYEIL